MSEPGYDSVRRSCGRTSLVAGPEGWPRARISPTDIPSALAIFMRAATDGPTRLRSTWLG